MAPAFRLDNVLPGQPAVELAAFRGRPVVLNFWAAWCEPCKREMPAFQRVHREFGDRVAFVGVDGNDSRRNAIALLTETGVTYPSGYDPQDRVYRAFRLVGRPTTVFIGADGRIRGTSAGELEAEELRELLDRHFGVK